MKTQVQAYLPKLLYLISIVITFNACQPNASEVSKDGSPVYSQALESGIKYKFHSKNNGRKVEVGDRLNLRVTIQNYQDTLLNDQFYEEHPFEGDNYLHRNQYFRQVISIMSEGDSLSFWLNIDSLLNKSGYLETTKIPAGTSIKYTLKLNKIQSKDEILKKLEEDLKVQREVDEKKIEKYVSELSESDTSINVIKTDTGLRYYLSQEGAGEYPTTNDTVIVNYTSKFIDGTIYDYSEENTEFLLDQVLPDGLKEGITLLREGSKGTFIIPSELGHGSKGMGTVVPPNSVVIFDVELIKVK